MNNIEISIVVPVYNESKRIENCFKKINDYFSAKKINYEVIFVDDCSQDNSVRIIEKLISGKPNYALLKDKVNHGKGYSVKKGILASCGKYVLFSDADLSTPITETDKLYNYIHEYPVVIGSRYLNSKSIKIKQPFLRRVVSRVGNLLIRLLLGLKFADTQCGFKMFEGAAAKEIFKRATIERWGFDIEILVIAKSLGYNVKEVPVDWYNEKNSKLHVGRDASNTLKELFAIRSNLKLGKYK